MPDCLYLQVWLYDIATHEPHMNDAGKSLITERQAFRIITTGEADIHSVAISSDGKVLLSSSQDGTVCLWDTQSGSLTKQLLPNASKATGASAVSVSPAGYRSACIDEAWGIRVWAL